MKLLVNKSVNPYYNLALEEYIFEHYIDDDYFLIWQNDNTIVVGKNQNTIEEINLDFVQEHSINVVRRGTGGGAVYHDLGNVNFSYITKYDQNAEHSMQTYTIPIINALKSMGIDAKVMGRNDITIDEKKVSGNAQRIYKGRILHHGTLLFDSDLSVLSQALKVKADKFESKGIKSVRSRVCNIKEYLDASMNLEDFIDYLERSIKDNYNSDIFVLKEEDLQQIQELCDSKFSTWGWNYGESPVCNIHNNVRFPGGNIEIFLSINKGYISICAIYGDFMAMKPIEDITLQLIGCKFELNEVTQCLSRFNLSEYFGSIKLEEIIQCIFGN